MTTRYWAFLSYSHADEAVAAKLHRVMEGFVLPARVRKAHGLPKRLFPIFRDVEELEAAGDLSARLQRALDDSRWLVVLCSPAAAASKYVNDEIEHFRNTRGDDRILCVLLDGEPAGSFPPAIHAMDKEPLAADLRAGKDFHTALLRLVAAMAGVSFTELRNREAQRKRRRQASITAVAAAALLASVGFWDAFHREHIDHYRHYVRVAGIWQGVDSMSPAAAASRYESYRFSRHGRFNPPDRVEYINGWGLCPDEGMEGVLGYVNPAGDYWSLPGNRYCGVQFEYDAGGALSREYWLNDQGQTLATLSYTGDGLGQFTEQGFSSESSGSGIRYIQFSRDAMDRTAKVEFLYDQGIPRPNDRRHFGYRFEFDSANRLVRTDALDDRGRALGEVTRYEYDNQGNRVAERFEDGTGLPRVGREGYVRAVTEFDSAGNWIQSSYFDENNQAIVQRSGCATNQVSRDSRGNATEYVCLGLGGRPAQGEWGVAVTALHYDPGGRLAGGAFLDADRKPVRGWNDTASFEIEFDQNNRPVESRYLDEEGNLFAGAVGAEVRMQYDDHGRKARECFYDEERRPVLLRWGHCIEWKYDRHGNIAEHRFLDTNRVLYLRDGGVARTVTQRDVRGNVISRQNYGTKGERVINKSCKCSIMKAKYDEFGNQVERRWYGVDEEPVAGFFGVSIMRFEYDRSGNKVGYQFFGPDEEPTLSENGEAGLRVEYDNRGRAISESYLGLDGAPAPRKGTPIVKTTYTYGFRGDHSMVDSESYFDRNDQLVARLERSFDRFGNAVLERWFSPEGSPMRDYKTGCAAIEREFALASRGAPVLERCLDEQGELTERKDTGWAVHKATFDLSRLVKEEYFDAAGNPTVVPGSD